MKTALYFKQTKPFTVKILGCTLGIFGLLAGLEDTTKLAPIITMFCLSILLLGYSISFEIKESHKHRKHFKLFGLTIFSFKLDCFIPEYVTVFSSNLVKGSDWGPVAAMGAKMQERSYLIRLFKGNKHFTLWRTKSESSATARAKNLAQVLNIEFR